MRHLLTSTSRLIASRASSALDSAAESRGIKILHALHHYTGRLGRSTSFVFPRYHRLGGRAPHHAYTRAHRLHYPRLSSLSESPMHRAGTREIKFAAAIAAVRGWTPLSQREPLQPPQRALPLRCARNPVRPARPSSTAVCNGDDGAEMRQPGHGRWLVRGPPRRWDAVPVGGLGVERTRARQRGGTMSQRCNVFLLACGKACGKARVNGSEVRASDSAMGRLT
jgi:hypothetical protein